jgi:hypothetical protein
MTPDWLITHLEERDNYYRYHVGLINLSRNGEKNFWSVPSISDPRYALHPTADEQTREIFHRAKNATPTT